MQYKRIYNEVKNREADYPAENFVRVEAWSPSEFGAPYLLAVTHGNTHSEDWLTEWHTKPSMLSEAQMIRLAIKTIDDYEFKIDMPPDNT